MSDYRVTVKVQNNNILSIIESRGYASMRDFCKKTGFVYATLMKMVNLKQPPIDRQGQMRSVVYKLADLLDSYPEELFSVAQMETALEDNRKTFNVSEAEAMFMLQNQQEQKLLEETVLEDQKKKALDTMISTLPPREAKVLRMRFGIGNGNEYTLEEISNALNVNRERVRQIEAKALRRLRCTGRSKYLEEFF